MFARVRRRLVFIRKERDSTQAESRRKPQETEWLELEIQYLQGLLKEIRRKWAEVVKRDVWQSISEDTLLTVGAEMIAQDEEVGRKVVRAGTSVKAGGASFVTPDRRKAGQRGGQVRVAPVE